jgi:hypothetical protein
MNTKLRLKSLSWVIFCAPLVFFAGCGQKSEDQTNSPTTIEETSAPAAAELTDALVENIVRQSYRFVAMYNVNNKAAFDTENPLSAGGLNRFFANTLLADHNLKAIARPNNDTLYVSALIDLTREPVIIESPAFDSKYVSMMITAYDHYVNIPMSTRQGDFSEPSRLLLYTERTPGYSGEAIEGVDKVAEMSGDFVSVVYRVMPHANEPERMASNLEAMRSIKATPLSEFQGAAAPQAVEIAFPDFGRSDYDVFENNFLEVMQFVFNHTTFEANDPIDQKILATFEPLGVVPGREFDPNNVVQIDGARLRAAAEAIFAEQMANTLDAEFIAANATKLFLLKGDITSDVLLFQSIIGPIGQPATEAVYPGISTADGTTMTAMHDYVIRMPADALPPATAFWSLTLYDLENGFFLPNDRKKYSVGENAGFQLEEDGGITIYATAKQPEGVPDENWLPMERGDYGVDIILRIYAPDLQAFATWTYPTAEILE